MTHSTIQRSLFLLLLILLSNLHLSINWIYTGAEIRDLYATTSGPFQNDANLWYATRVANGQKYSQCPPGSTNFLLGGYDVLGGTSGTTKGDYFERSYSGLASHTMIRYSINFWFLDTWDGGADGFWLYLDGERRDGWHLSTSSFTTPQCGLATNDLPNRRIVGKIPHVSSSFTFRVVSTLNSPPNDESFGFREVNFLLDKNPMSGETFCGTPPLSPRISSCSSSCPDGYYYSGGCVACDPLCQTCFDAGPSNCYSCAQTGGISWDGYKCITCAGNCDTCLGTSATECTSCKSGAYVPRYRMCITECPYPLNRATVSGVLTCTSPCGDDEFIYWDKTCGATCPSPFQSKPDISVYFIKYCIYPCSSQDYLLWDGSCARDCAFPLKNVPNRGLNVCTYVCQPGEYLFPDGTCGATCDFPLVIKEYKDKLFCVSPCNVPGEHLYPNQECTLTCAPYYSTRTTQGIAYCDYPCANNDDFLYWDGLCLPDCIFPLQVRIQRNSKFCDYPGTLTYLYWDGTSSLTCDLPLIIDTLPHAAPNLLCTYPCEPWEYLYWESTCSNDCVFPLTKRLSNGKRFCDYSCTGSDYLYWNGTCISTCDFPLQIRTEKGQLFCDFPAGDITQFLYWDGTFEPTCPLPLFTRIEGSPMVRKFCDFICTSASLPFLSWDGSCVATCNTPSLIKGYQLCSFPCGEHYLNYDGSCITKCTSPSVVRFEGIGKYCDHPCQPNIFHFYYYNRDCRGHCLPPLKQVRDENITWCIYPCSNEQFLYTNGSCSESCDIPFRSYVDSDQFNYCLNPCPNSRYLAWNGTCLDVCDPPFHVQYFNMGSLCVKPCSDPFEYFDEITKTCIKECNTPSMAEDGIYLICLADRNDYSNALDFLIEAPIESSFTLVTVPYMLQYLRYLDMEFPIKLQNLVKSPGKPILSIRFRQEMPKDLQDYFPRYSLPTIFEKNNLHSSFVVNFWKEMVSWVIVVILTILFSVLELLCKSRNWNRLKIFFEKLKNIAKWNLLFILVGTCVSDVILFTVLELRTLHLSSSLSALSFELSLAVFFAIVVLPLGTIHLAKKFEKNSQFQPDVKHVEFLVKWQGYQVLYQGFRDNNRFNRRFYMLYIIRLAIPGLIASILYMSPITQIILYTILNLITVGYIWFMKPLTRYLDHVQLLTLEIFILAINSSLIGLYIVNKLNVTNEGAKVMLGDIIVSLNSGVNILFLTILAIKLIEGIKSIYQFQRYQPKKDWSAWLQLIVYVLQQGGMGFESMFIDPQTEFIIHREKQALEREQERKQAILTEMRKREYIKSKMRRVVPEETLQKKEEPLKKSESVEKRAQQAQKNQKKGTKIAKKLEESIVLDESVREEVPSNLHVESRLMPLAGSWNDVSSTSFLKHRRGGMDSSFFNQ